MRARSASEGRTHARRTEFTGFGDVLVDTITFNAWDPETQFNALMPLDNFQYRVPEPLTLGVMLSGGLLFLRRRSRKP